MSIAGSLFGGAAASGIGALVGNLTAAGGSAAAQKTITNQMSQNTSNFQPYLSAGSNALGKYMDMAGLNGTAAQNSYYTNGPGNVSGNAGYQAAEAAGSRAIMNNAAAMGENGAQGNTNYNLYGNAANLTNQYQQQEAGYIGNLVNTGQSSATALTNANSQLALGAANAQTQTGILQGAAFNGLGNAVGGSMNGLAGLNAYSQASGKPINMWG